MSTFNKALGFTDSDELLQAVLDTYQSTINIYVPIRNDVGKIIDFEWVIANKRAFDFTENKRPTGERFTKLFPGATASGILEKMICTIETGNTQNFDLDYDADGIKGSYKISSVKLGQGLILTSEDVTSAKKAEMALLESKSMLQGIIDAINFGIVVCSALRNEKGEIIDFIQDFTNKRTINVLGVDMTGRLLSEYGQSIQDQREKFIETVDEQKVVNYTRLLNIQGHERWALLSNAPLSADRMVHVWEDITELKRVEGELVKLKLRQQKEIMNAIIMAQEQERERIGESLHNGVAQLLYGIKTRLERIEKGSSKNEKLIHSIFDILDEAINDTRKISFELVPVVLKDHGLETAVRALFQRTDVSIVNIHFQMQGISERLPEKLEYALYRIIQELLNNIIKHSQAKVAQIALERKGKKLQLTVKDNGTGFDPKSVAGINPGIGLQHIRQRLKLLDGSMKIESNASGTMVVVKLPQ